MWLLKKSRLDKLLSKLRKAIQRIALTIGFLILGSQNLFASTTSDSIDSSLKKLSYEERFFLRTFFLSFLKNDDLGHVLFYDTKPVCFGAIDKKCRRKSCHQKQLLKGWECWKTYENLFPHPNFLFIEEQVVFGDDVVIHIFVINKTTTSRIIEQNISLFKEILGTDFSVDYFFHSIQNQQSVRGVLNHNEALLGIILGYGTGSSFAYSMRHQIINKDDEDWEAPEWTTNYNGIEAQCPKKCKLHPVGFVGNPQSVEVKMLLDQYTWELKGIWIAYRQSKDPLKLALDSLCGKE